LYIFVPLTAGDILDTPGILHVYSVDKVDILWNIEKMLGVIKERLR